MVSAEVKTKRSRPILFSGAMVRAILEGQKTQTRRIVHPKTANKPCPYGVIGDTLWVRETFCEIDGKIIYRATAPKDFQNPGYWQPSILMPRKVCRIELKILDNWVEPLNSICEEDAMAEGFRRLEKPTLCRRDQVFDSAVEAFKALWEKINGAGSWEKNPMVWVIEFEVIK